MTSNLASEEIANYAQDLRREQEKKPPLVNGAVPPGKLIFLLCKHFILYPVVNISST